MPIWTNYDKFCYYISNISSSLQKFQFLIEVVLNSLQTKIGLELVSRSQFLQKKVLLFFITS